VALDTGHSPLGSYFMGSAMNARLWNSLEKTDPAYTKPFSRGGGFKGTAINSTYILKRLTEAFGPCGKGWKFVLEDEQIHEGHKLKSGDVAKLHVVRGHIEYRIDDTWYSTSPQFGQTMLVDANKNGTFMDEEAPKKSITDCISKCAVLLGLAADVHLGLFDDNKYVNQRKEEEESNGEVISEAQFKELQTLIEETKSDIELFLDYVGAPNLASIPSASFPRAKAALMAKKKKA